MNEHSTATITRELTGKTYNHHIHSNYITNAEYIPNKDIFNFEQQVSEISSKSWLDDFGWL